MKKYEFTGETMEFEGRTLQLIRYVRDIGGFVPKGELGGWIEHEGNLSHDGMCYVAKESKVFGNSRVVDNAIVNGGSILKDNVFLLNESHVSEQSIVGGDTIISGDSYIFAGSKISFYAHVMDENYGGILSRPNISNSTIQNSIIEATGELINCHIKNEELFGMLDY